MGSGKNTANWAPARKQGSLDGAFVLFWIVCVDFVSCLEFWWRTPLFSRNLLLPHLPLSCCAHLPIGALVYRSSRNSNGGLGAKGPMC